MHWMIALIGALATIAFVAVSGWMNFRFGLSLGRDVIDGHVFAVASISADGMKAILPFVIVAAWRNIRPVMLVASAGLWVLCSAYSLTSSLGFAASNRAEVTSAKRIDVARHARLAAALKSKQSQIEQLGRRRDPAVMQSELARLRQHRRWLTTRGCKNATVAPSREFCKEYFRTQAQQAKAAKADRLERDIDRLRKHLNDWKGFAGKSIDPQISVIDQIVGLGEDRVTLAVTVLLSIMLEVGSGLGFFLVLQKAREPEPRSGDEPRSTIELQPAQRANAIELDWLRQRLRSDGLASLALWEAHADYLSWSDEHRSRDTHTLSEFARWLEDEAGLQLTEVKGQQHVAGVCLATQNQPKPIANADSNLLTH